MNQRLFRLKYLVTFAVAATAGAAAALVLTLTSVAEPGRQEPVREAVPPGDDAAEAARRVSAEVGFDVHAVDLSAFALQPVAVRSHPLPMGRPAPGDVNHRRAVVEYRQGRPITEGGLAAELTIQVTEVLPAGPTIVDGRSVQEIDEPEFPVKGWRLFRISDADGEEDYVTFILSSPRQSFILHFFTLPRDQVRAGAALAPIPGLAEVEPVLLALASP